MEKARKRRFGLVATIVTLVLAALAIFLGVHVASNTHRQDTLDKIKTTKVINWGVKIDTKLFGLMNTKTGQPEGFDVDIAKEITKRIGAANNIELKSVLVPVNSSSRIQLLKNSNIDGIVATMTITEDRKKIVNFTQPYFNAGQSLLVPESSNINNVSQLDNQDSTVLAVVGSTSIDNIKRFAPKARVLALQDLAQTMSALKANQGQALTTDSGILYGLADENPGYKVVGGTFTTEPYGIAFDKGDDKMTTAANKALDEIIADGTYNKIIEKWFGKVPGMNIQELLK